jgi:polysaccharide pyruvyl transferase WcaK-like protein
MHQKSALLLGSYGQTNLGDDLLMYNYLAWLKSHGFTRIVVNASTNENIPQVVRDEFPDLEVRLTYKTSLLDWVKILRGVDCVVYGGGTIYKELYATTGRSRYAVISRILAFNILTRVLGRPIYNMHIGLGVLKTAVGKWITKLGLQTATLTLLRDEQSYHFALDTLGLPGKKLCSTTDGLFITDRWQRPWRAGVSLPKGKYKHIVGANFLSDIPDWVDRDSYLQAVREFVTTLVKDNNLVVLLPFQHSFNPNSDYEFMQKEILPYVPAAKNLVLVPNLPLEQAVATFREFDVFVGMRFHSLLLSTSVATPFIGLAYDTKCWRFMKEIDYPYAIRLEDINAQKLHDMYQTVLYDLPPTRNRLSEITDDQLTKGQECISKVRL